MNVDISHPDFIEIVAQALFELFEFDEENDEYATADILMQIIEDKITLNTDVKNRTN